LSEWAYRCVSPTIGRAKPRHGRHCGLLRDLTECFLDYRHPCYIEHTVQELLSQRIYGLVLGYEDLNDHDYLRRDPVHGLICGKRDPLGQDRLQESDKDKALAAHSTLNRLELSAQGIDLRYHKIEPQPLAHTLCRPRSDFIWPR
jgi:Transposase DDE domain group 1